MNSFQLINLALARELVGRKGYGGTPWAEIWTASSF